MPMDAKDGEARNDLLAGVVVLDFTLAAVGPFCSRVLADLGAEVIHVEWPRYRWGGASVGDEETRFSPELVADPGERGSQLFLHTNGGKRSLAVNLKEPDGVALIKAMIPSVDVVVENMTPRVMRGFGLDYETLSAINPRLVMCSLTGFGQDGLDGDTARSCTDPVALAMSGLSWITGERDGAPYAVGGGLGDSVTSMTGVVAILAALFGRQATGRGQFIDIAMVEALAYVDCTALPEALMCGRETVFRNGQQGSYTFPMGPFRGTGGFVAIQAPGAGPESPWGRLCLLMGRTDMLEDPRYENDYVRLDHVADVVDAVERWLCSFDDVETPLVLLGAERISSGPVLAPIDLPDHPYFVERGTFTEVDYPEVGPVTVMRPPFRFSHADARVRGVAPEMGEGTRVVVAELGGLSAEEIDDLFARGVLFESAGARRRVQALP
jgi:CoA:oxalate CoA-transferase